MSGNAAGRGKFREETSSLQTRDRNAEPIPNCSKTEVSKKGIELTWKEMSPKKPSLMSVLRPGLTGREFGICQLVGCGGEADVISGMELADKMRARGDGETQTPKSACVVTAVPCKEMTIHHSLEILLFSPSSRCLPCCRQ